MTGPENRWRKRLDARAERPTAFSWSVNGKLVQCYKWQHEPTWRMYPERDQSFTVPEMHEVMSALRAEHPMACVVCYVPA